MDEPAPPAGRLAGRAAREAALLAGVAVVQLVPTTFAARRQPDALALWPWGYALLVLAVALLPLRHRHPAAVLAAVFAVTLGYWTVGFPHGPVFAALVVAYLSAWAAGRRRVAILALAAGYLLFPWLAVWLGRADPPPLQLLYLLAAWLVAIGALSEVVRYRRERAQQAARARAEAARRTAQEERLRIAREVHDAVAHTMSLISIQAGVALHRGAGLPRETREALTVIRTASRESLTELRGILGVLRDDAGRAPRAPTPGLARIGDLRRWAGQVGLDVAFELPPDGELPALPGAVDAAAYRIMQEALTNVVRHAPGAAARVSVGVADGALKLAVTDDGGGRAGPPSSPPPVPPPGDGSGNGIAGMRERAVALGGTLAAGPRPGGGFAVRARLPLPEGAAT